MQSLPLVLMSSSKPKNTPATCPKCKHRFEFERVPKMVSVVCPHCDAKIRLKRKKREAPSATRPPSCPAATASTAETEVAPEPRADIITGGRRLRSKSRSAPPPAPKLPTPDPVVPQRRYPRPSNATVGNADTAAPTTSEKLPTPSPVAPPKLSTPDPVIPDPLDEPNPFNLPGQDVVAAVAVAVASTDQAELADLPEQVLENDLLPPKFLVPDIEADENAVVLPTAAGGTQVVDRTEVTVTHGGQTIKLVASTPEELRKIRLIENLVALLIAGIMLAIAVWLVL